MPNIKDILPQPPWDGPPIPRGWSKGEEERIERELVEERTIELGGKIFRVKVVKVVPGLTDYLWRGAYDPVTKQIWIRGNVKNLMVLAHEFGHAAMGHGVIQKGEWKTALRNEVEASLWAYNLTGLPRKIGWLWKGFLFTQMGAIHEVTRKEMVLYMREVLDSLGAPEAWKEEFRRKPGGRY